MKKPLWIRILGGISKWLGEEGVSLPKSLLEENMLQSCFFISIVY